MTPRSEPDLKRGLRNLARMHTCPADTLSVVALLDHDTVILTEGAVRRVEALWGGERALRRRAPIPEVST